MTKLNVSVTAIYLDDIEPPTVSTAPLKYKELLLTITYLTPSLLLYFTSGLELVLIGLLAFKLNSLTPTHRRFFILYCTERDIKKISV